MASEGMNMDISSSAPSYAQGGTATGGTGSFGDFNFKTASGASSTGSGLSTPTLVVVGILGLAALVWFARRK